MILEPVGTLPGHEHQGTSSPGAAPVLAGNYEVAAQIERAYPGYHVWISDAGWWYATRTHSWARGQSATVHGPGPGELTGALAAEEAAIIGCAMTGAW
jgi:hypothetical protein